MNLLEDMASIIFHDNFDLDAARFNKLPLPEQIGIMNTVVFDLRSVVLTSSENTHAISSNIADQTAEWLFAGLLEEEKPAAEIPEPPAPVPEPERHKLPFLTRAKIAFHFLWNG